MRARGEGLVAITEIGGVERPCNAKGGKGEQRQSVALKTFPMLVVFPSLKRRRRKPTSKYALKEALDCAQLLSFHTLCLVTCARF